METNRIAYHPIRVSPHASLFLPYSEQELKVYQLESLNTLRLPSSSGPASTIKAPPPAIPNNDNDLGPGTDSNVESNSPPEYAASSPFPIPLESFFSRRMARTGPQISTSSPQISTSGPQISTSSPQISTSGPQISTSGPQISTSGPQISTFGRQMSISETVAQHYNSRPNLTKGARTESPIFGLRKLNNWIKSVIIGKFASVESPIIAPLLRYQNNDQMYYQQQRSPGTKILELGCGKGGDLAKWQNAGVRELYGLDIARVSVEQAQSRYLQGCQKKFYAKFFALDCFSLPITSVLSPEELRDPFHAVSLQFCMHYAFENETKARTMMENASKFLIPGGVMIGTIPDPDLLIQNWEGCSNDSNQVEPSFGNSVYQITFPYQLSQTKKIDQIYGNRYTFYLQDAVEDVPEYLVLWEPFVELAREYGLRLIYKQSFHEIVKAEKFDLKFKMLLSKMNLINSDGNLLISDDHWEACGIYLAFAFIKE